MPHATETTTMTNGSSPQSKFLNHLNSYPVVSDSVSTFKDHPYGKKSIEIADGVYSKYGKAVEPYLEKPYGYAKPYVAKADELADSGLTQVDSRFPIVKEETSSLVEKGRSVVWWPFSLAGQGKDYVFSTYNDEYSKTASHKSRGPGLTTSAMALVSTELKIASDFFQAVADFLGPKYEESKSAANQYIDGAKENIDHYQTVAADKVNEYTKVGEEKAEEAKNVGAEKKEQAKGQAKKGQQEVERKVEQAQK